jgi:hypothetical protein
MVEFPHDQLDAWRGPYPAHVFAAQFRGMHAGFDAAADALEKALGGARGLSRAERAGASEQVELGRAAALHFRSVANQTEFVVWRGKALAAGAGTPARKEACRALERLLRDELDAARALHRLQRRDARI